MDEGGEEESEWKRGREKGECEWMRKEKKKEKKCKRSERV